MISEERKFLDLDMVAQQISDSDDRSLFQEAVNCYYAGSHRAAAILAWYAAANCLKRRIFSLSSEGDALAKEVADNLTEGEPPVGEEEKLIVAARKCELIDDYEERSLRFARDTRNKSAHPTGIVPSAEAVRHVLFITSQYVLSRKGYRGMGYIRDTVTTQFDDIHFLPNPQIAADHCREILERVPQRLWVQFVKIAADERGVSTTDTWQKNAHAFFSELIKAADDSTISAVANAFMAFESKSSSFFDQLAGIDRRVAEHMGKQKRSQVRDRLRQSNVVAIRTDGTVHAWATLCAIDGLEDEDLELLRARFQYLAKSLAEEAQLFTAQRQPIIRVVGELLTDDTTSSDAARGCLHLFPTSLFDYDEEDERSRHAVQVIVEELIRRFVRDERHYALLENVKLWHSKLIIQLLERSSLYWTECSEDRPDHVGLLFDARDELVNRNPMTIPSAFSAAIRDILLGKLRPEWLVEESEAGQVFYSRLTESDYNEAGVVLVRDEDIWGDDYWRSQLGVDISSTQVMILELSAAREGVTAEQVAGNLIISTDEAKQDIEYLVLQALLIFKDGRYFLREDLRPLITPTEPPITEQVE